MDPCSSRPGDVQTAPEPPVTLCSLNNSGRPLRQHEKINQPPAAVIPNFPGRRSEGSGKINTQHNQQSTPHKSRNFFLLFLFFFFTATSRRRCHSVWQSHRDKAVKHRRETLFILTDLSLSESLAKGSWVFESFKSLGRRYVIHELHTSSNELIHTTQITDSNRETIHLIGKKNDSKNKKLSRYYLRSLSQPSGFLIRRARRGYGEKTAVIRSFKTVET